MAKAYKRLRRQRTQRQLKNQRFMEPSKRPLNGRRKKSFIRSLSRALEGSKGPNERRQHKPGNISYSSSMSGSGGSRTRNQQTSRPSKATPSAMVIHTMLIYTFQQTQ